MHRNRKAKQRAAKANDSNF